MADPNCWKCGGTGEHLRCLEYGCVDYDDEGNVSDWDNCYPVACDCDHLNWKV